MQEFRRFVRGPVGKVLLAAIILPFVDSKVRTLTPPCWIPLCVLKWFLRGWSMNS